MDFRATVLLFVVVLLTSFGVWACRSKSARAIEPAPADRVTAARAKSEGVMRERCKAAHLPYPPRDLFLRAFKSEAELEVWAGDDDGALRLLATYPFTATSGGPGPKRREGDRQIPEGCYRVTIFNAQSNFYLSLGLDYPNASDQVRSDRERPGDEIYIHGGAKTIGCIALGDPAIEELFLLALDVHGRGGPGIPVHIFPGRMRGETWAALEARHPEHQAFWAELQVIHDAFEENKRALAVEVTIDGAYRVAAPL